MGKRFDVQTKHAAHSKDWVRYVLPAPESNITKVRTSPRKPKPMREWWDLDVMHTINYNDASNQPPPPPPAVTTLAEKEVWSNENRYGLSVSTFGRVQLKSGRITFGSPVSKNRGHLRVSVRHPMRANKQIKLLVHRLVRETFDDKRIVRRALANGWVVNHINNDPADNHISNLEWVTKQGNADHYYEQIYPDKQKTELVNLLLGGKGRRAVWIVDEQGRIVQANRKVNVWNDADREWLKEQGLWASVEALL